MAIEGSVWLSVDPVNKKVDFYPKAIAARIEESLMQQQGSLDDGEAHTCELGSDFFNATVHFHPSGSMHQSTPGMSLGRGGFKQPGYRSVMRVEKQGGIDSLTLNARRVFGEWRISKEGEPVEYTFEVNIPEDCVVSTQASPIPSSQLKPWTAADLDSGAWDAPVVVWQWCRGVPEREGPVWSLPDEWWCPYHVETNAEIERAFQADESATISIMDRELQIQFTKGSTFALQQDQARGKERAIRRTVKIIQELGPMLRLLKEPGAVDLESMQEGMVPPEFFCAITQEIMRDPVTTCDGFTYERYAIERWFGVSDANTPKSPLTGLPLANPSLVPNESLKLQIQEMLAKQQAGSETVS